MKTPPSRQELEWILERLDGEPGELVRSGERIEDREAVIALLLEQPALLQRPLALRGERALIARPPERVLELLD